MPSRLNLPSQAEKVNELDDKDNDHHHFQHECAALVEPIHHKSVQFTGSAELLIDQSAVIGNPDSVCRQAVYACGKCIAQKLDRIVDTLGELPDIKLNRVQTLGFASQTPAPQKAGAALTASYTCARRRVRT